MDSLQLQALIGTYMEVFWQAAPGSGLEAASRHIVDVLSGQLPLASLDNVLRESREALASATQHLDIGAFIFFTEQVALLEHFQAQVAELL